MRPTWKGFLKLSLVNIPVCLYPAARSQSVSFNQLHKECSSRIKYEKWCPTCDRGVRTDEIVKGYEYAKDQYIVLDEEDFSKVRLESNKSIAIVQFVNQAEIDPIFYYGSHYIVPDGPVGVESFTTVLRAMEEKGRIALAKVVMSGKEQMVAIRPKDGALVMSSLFYGDEVRSIAGVGEIQSPPEVNPQELALATQLIEAITRPFDPNQFEDRYRNAVLDVIKAKVEGREVVEAPQVETGKIINLMEALKSSLERARTEPTTRSGGADEDKLSATGTESATSG